MTSIDQIHYNPTHLPGVQDAWNTPVATELGYTLEFARFSTVLHQCFPSLALGRHEAIYQAACAYQALAMAEQTCPWRAQTLRTTPLPRLLLRRPGIIATFHTGSYRLLPRWLQAQALPFALVVSGDVLEQQGARYREQAGQPPEGQFDIINAEQPDALFRMRRAMARGQYLLVYADGYTGSGHAHRVVRNGMGVPFGQATIHVRTGIGVVAYLADCPVYTVSHLHRTDGGLGFRVDEAWKPDRALRRDEAARATTARLYGILEELVGQEPAQWENWFGLHRQLVLPPLAAQSTPADRAAWIRFGWQGRPYRLDRTTGECRPDAR